MFVKVALNHQTAYRFDRLVYLGPHIVRLRPAPHCRTPIQRYSFQVHTPEHTLHWLQDPYANFLARLTFPNPTAQLKLEVDLIAELHPINPFDFFLEPYAEKYPFTYEDDLAKELIPFLEITETGSLLREWLATVDRKEQFITDFIVSINARMPEEIAYEQRLESGIQFCEETLARKIGSCRDSSWLLVQIMRHFGLAARFVSGYLIDLASQEKPQDSADLHAWAEVYLPGAGWVGLDPTSGLLAAEGHIPLACTANPERAAAVTGSTEACSSTLDFSVTVSRWQE